MKARQLVWNAVVLGVACEEPTSGLDQEESLAGHYQGTAEWTREGVQFSVLASITFQDPSGELSGSFITNRGQRGTVHGSVSDAAVTFMIDQTAPCDGTFAGSGIFFGDPDGFTRLTGTYSGSSPCTGSVQATFELVRYPPSFEPLLRVEPRE